MSKLAGQAQQAQQAQRPSRHSAQQAQHARLAATEQAFSRLCPCRTRLNYLHSRRPPMSHRDLKSPNVLLSGAAGGENRAGEEEAPPPEVPQSGGPSQTAA